MHILNTAITALIVLHLAACHSPSTSKTPQVAKITIAEHPNTRQEIWFYAFSLVGTPYRYGGNDKSHGFDCSGMVQYVYQQATRTPLPRTARQIAQSAHPIAKSKLKSGDLVFFNTGNGRFSHVGIYLGNQEFLHAPSSNGTIRVARLDNPYFEQRFTGARTLMR